MQVESNVRVIDSGQMVAITIYHRIVWTSIFVQLLDTKDRPRNIIHVILLQQKLFYCIPERNAMLSIELQRIKGQFVHGNVA